MKNSQILELREPSAWALNEFYLYYDELKKYPHCHQLEAFCEYLDEAPEFAYIVFKMADLWRTYTEVSLSEFSVYDLHELIFKWSFEVLEASTREAPQSDKPTPEYMHIAGDPYHITVAKIWLGGTAITEVIQATKMLSQGEINEIIRIYNTLQLPPEERFKEWSKKKASEDVLKGGLSGWGDEIEL